MDRDALLVIGAPFEDPEHPGKSWFCRDCATMEAALSYNPDWEKRLNVQRLAYPRPRWAVIELIGEENQSLPALVLADASKAPEGAKIAANGRAFITDPKIILRYLTSTYGGVGQHP